MVDLSVAPTAASKVSSKAAKMAESKDSLKVGQWAVTMAGPWDFPRAVD